MNIKKADELEMSVNYKAMRLSWVFVVAALLTWCIVGYIKDGAIPFIPFVIFAAQNILFFSAKLVITRRLVGKEKKSGTDNEE